MSKAIGNMDKAFFVGRGELLGWLNNDFGANYTKVEQCASGAIHCAVVNAIYPGSVQMKAVKWDAKHEHEFISNYKVLQKALNKHKIDKVIEVERLVKAKYQDNLEFLQWIKRFYDMHKSGDTEPQKLQGASATPAPGATPKGVRMSGAAGSARSTKAAPPAFSGNRAPAAGAAAGAGASDETSAQLRLMVEGLEKERDFYFGKLRDIEILCQNHETDPGAELDGPKLVASIQKILYATEEGFECVEDAE